MRDTDQEVPAASAAGTPWSPILTEPARSRAVAAVAQLRQRIDGAGVAGDRNASLSAGSAGLAVFYAELDRCEHGSDAGARADGHLERAVDVLSSTALGASLYAGFCGIAWAAEAIGKLRDSGDDVNEEIDEAVLQLLGSADWRLAPYDLIYGLTGLGVYALERWPRPAAARALARIVDELAGLARHDQLGSYWWTPPELLLGPRREQHPNGGVDLGVAHGVAGPISLLARAATLGVGGSEATTLARQSLEWLLSHAIEGDSGTTIPYFLAEGEAPVAARLAWCYGDAGVAAALLAAGKDANEPAYIDAATQLALRAAARLPETSGVTDTGFCHGSAGLAHLFNRMYQTTREPSLLAAARFWIEQTLERLEDEEAPYNGVGLLEGAAGAALVLVAATGAVEPHWDRMFLVAPVRRAIEAPWADASSVATT